MAAAAPSRTLLLGVENADGTVTGVTTGISQPIYREADGILSFFLRSIGVTSGGTILIEEADWGPNENPYSGTWSQITSIAASSFTGGAQSAFHITDSSFGYVRVRISSTITGGGTILVSLRSRGAL